MGKEYFEEFEECYEITHDQIITTQFKREGDRYLDRTVRRAYEVFKIQQQKIDEYILVAETLDQLYVREIAKNAELKKQIDIMQGLHLFNLQKLRDSALKRLEDNGEKAWVRWKEGADMYDQGAANAFEEAYWLVHDVMSGE